MNCKLIQNFTQNKCYLIVDKMSKRNRFTLELKYKIVKLIDEKTPVEEILTDYM